MTTPSIFVELETSILQLDPAAKDCRLKILELRRTMDGLCDHGEITIAQWRQLLDRISTVQARCTP